MAADRHDELRVERFVGAPPEAVWAAWTTETGLAGWWWAGWDDTTYDVDLRIGCRYRIASASGGVAVSGEFTDLDPPRRLEMTWLWEDDDGTGPVEHVVVEFAEDTSGTMVTVLHKGPWSTPDPATAYQQGWDHVLDRLASLWRESDTLSPADETLDR